MNFRTDSRLKNEDGIVLIITMLCIVALIGIVGLVVDSGMMEYRKLTLQKAANAATLRASQLYYDGEVDPAKIEAAVRAAAKINLIYSGLDSTEAGRSANTLGLTTDTAANTVSARLSAPQQMYFAQVMPGVEGTREMSTTTAASYLRKEDARQHFRHLFIVTSVFFSMGAPFQTKGDSVDNPQNITTAPEGSKSDNSITGLQELIDLLDGERLTLVGTALRPNVLTSSLPIDDQPSTQSGMSNRDYAKLQAERLLELNAAEGLAKSLALVADKIKKLTVAEREEALVLVISDGLSIDVSLPFLGRGCDSDMASAMEEANGIRALGVTVSTVGMFSSGSVDSHRSQYDSADLLLIAEVEGRKFLKSLAAASAAPVDCDVVDDVLGQNGLGGGGGKSGQKVYPTRQRIGTYLEPRTAREVAIYLDGTTSRESFTARLPHRVLSK